ncbi:hypothetical protein [Pedobacter metabolipauper]|uniref:Uncharacterized protein n=1 Tax=Pedobacter metabolipauper TaxID=425513 RepID=A0A4R6T1R1_9SPHI|nr:hypothetical protein [Pedobacter metabolipauper]TDQ11598.1 hypothetical protein ATK78_0721 [Pedobacter metabolipauper]
MKESPNTKFTIRVQAEGLTKEDIAVHYADTSDGTPYYVCKIDGHEVQLRKDDEKWEQIWGELNQEQVDALGAEINKHLV